MTIDGQTLTATWHVVNADFQNRMKYWIALVAKSAETENFDVEQFLEDLFAESNMHNIDGSE